MPEQPTTLKPYGEWARLGRQVRAGQKAQWFATDEDRSRHVALFAEEQTDEMHEDGLAGLNIIIPREQAKLKGPNRKREHPRIRVRVIPATGGLAVWCGNQKEVIKILKAAGWYFDRGPNRWVHHERKLEKFVPAMEAKGIEVVVDED